MNRKVIVLLESSVQDHVAIFALISITLDFLLSYVGSWEYQFKRKSNSFH